MPILTPEQHLKRVALVNKGLTARKISDVEGTSYSTIANWAKRHKIKVTKDPDPRCKVDWRGCFDAGMTLVDAAKMVGRPRHQARTWAARKGLIWPDADVAGLTQQQIEDVQVLVKAGGYGIAAAREVVTRPKVKVPLMVPKAPCEVRA
jgi:hypothetical protein